MADNRKYYYLKLKESYFDEDAIVLLESMQDGMLYSNILLKLYQKSLKNGGRLQLAENIPYTAQIIAIITRQQVGTVERALQIIMKLGLVEPLQNGALYMSNIELIVLLGMDNFLSVWQLHINQIGQELSPPLPFNQPRRNFLYGENEIDPPGLVSPAIKLGEVRSVQQERIGQGSSMGQRHIHQELRVGEIGRQIGIYRHVVSHGVGLLGVGLFRPPLWAVRGPFWDGDGKRYQAPVEGGLESLDITAFSAVIVAALMHQPPGCTVLLIGHVGDFG